jgi:hypothetical protein
MDIAFVWSPRLIVSAVLALATAAQTIAEVEPSVL